MPAVSNIISLADLRETLEMRFPEARPPVERHWETGWAPIDDSEGGLKQNAVTEVCSPPVCGGFFLHHLLRSVGRRQSFAGLVDCGRTFDPGSYEVGSRVLGVFCETADQGVKVTDLLLRDGNLPLVLLDLQTMPLRSLGKIPANTWHRFQRLVEKSGTALVVLTPQPLVEAARMRITLRGGWDLAALRRPRRELIGDVEVQVFRRGKRFETIPAPLVQTA